MVLPEIVAAGIYNSRLVVKNTAVSKDRKTTRFELELPLEDGGISYIDGTPKTITPNMLICAKPGQVRHTKFPYKCYFVHMILQDDSLRDILMDTPDFLEIQKADAYRAIFSKLMKYYNGGADSTLLLQSVVLELLHKLRLDSASYATHRHQKSTHPAIEKALIYIHDHLTEDLSLNTVANAVSLSTIHFHNCFHRVIGKTLREYVEEQRIKKAIHLLISTDFSLTEIAFACGFSSQSYFSYVFKRNMKQTPREYVQTFYGKYEI